MLKYTVKKTDEVSEEIYKESYFYMNEERREKVRRYKNIQAKKCTLLGEWLVRQMLSEITGEDRGHFLISADEKGKLYSQNTPGLHFNISHSEDTVAVVVSDCNVGIDIETFRKIPLNLAKRVCNADELVYVFGKKPAEDDFKSENADYIKRFLEIWTAKEALFKYVGTGITDFKKLNVLSDDFKRTMIENTDYIIHIVTE